MKNDKRINNKRYKKQQETSKELQPQLIMKELQIEMIRIQLKALERERNNLYKEKL